MYALMHFAALYAVSILKSLENYSWSTAEENRQTYKPDLPVLVVDQNGSISLSPDDFLPGGVF